MIDCEGGNGQMGFSERSGGCSGGVKTSVAVGIHLQFLTDILINMA